MKPLTAEEIAHYARADAANEMDAREYREVFPRLLDEVERWRNPEAVRMWRDENAATLERSRALLKRIEWEAGTGARCASCWAYRERGHEPGCELAALLSGDRQG